MLNFEEKKYYASTRSWKNK